jgi:hypothetical protein
MGADTAPLVHQPPVFLCAPAKIESSTPDIKKTFEEDPAKPAAWPTGTNLRLRVLPDQKYHPLVLNIIKHRASDWLSLLQGPLSYTWVDSGDSDIRISFNGSIPSWSCTGTQAKQYDQSHATMNFSLNPWTKDNKVIYSHRQISRIALHLFGHAFGLCVP